MNAVQAYIEAFNRHYPTHSVEVRYRRKFDRYVVKINGEAGDLALTIDDLREATRAFNR